MKKAILFLFTLLFASSIFSQVTSVKFQVDFNDDTGFYDCKLFIEAGSATTFPQRAQFNSQYSIVVPTGTVFSIEESYLPLEDNIDGMSTTPMEWNIGQSAIAPSEAPNLDFYAIVPTLDPIAAFNELEMGQTLTLFSISVTDISCDLDVRAYEIDYDPAINSNGQAYMNGYTIGGPDQLYNGNLLPSIFETELNDFNICQGECADIITNFNCSFPGVTYEWNTGETEADITICPTETTTYSLTISGPNSYTNVLDVLVTVSDLPLIELVGESEICVGENTYFLPEVGGTWTSDDPGVAVITNEGVVTGISPGNVSFTFTDWNGCFNFSENILVRETPPISFTGPTSICLNETTQMSPSTGGFWSSSDEAIATIDDSGLVTAIGFGSTTFVFTSIEGCNSVPSDQLIVQPGAQIDVPDDRDLCIGETALVFPSEGGTWSSSDETVATVTNQGMITAISPGMVIFEYTADNGDCSNSTPDFTVYPDPIITIEQSDTICVGGTTLLSSSEGEGTWTSANPAIATIDNITGEVTGISIGWTVFNFTSTESGCNSENSEVLTVLEGGNDITLVGEDTICIGGTTYFETLSQGSWSVSDQSVVTYTNTGVLTGIGSGTITATFTPLDGSCPSISPPIYVMPIPTELIGPDQICIGGTTQILPNTGGSWYSYDESIATIDSFGLITGVGEGATVFGFRDSIYCFSDPSDTIFVLPGEYVDLETSNICIGESTQAVGPAGLAVTWSTSDPNVATIDVFTGQITGVGPGTVTVQYTNQQTGCISHISETLTVTACTPELALTCNEAIVICDIDLINGYQGSMPSNPSPGIQPNPLCDDGGLPNNISWIGFVAPEGQYDITLSFNNCQGSTIGDEGIQIGIYTDCSFTETVFCDPNCSLNAVTINSSILTPGQAYYLFIDGCAGSYCDFEIQVSGQYESICDDPCYDLTGNTSTISGIAFIDDNNNGVFDAMETPLRNVMVSTTPGEFSILTNDDGEYSITLPKGDYDLTANVNEGMWISDELSFNNLTLDRACYEEYDFAFVPTSSQIPNLALSFTNTILRCDFETRFTITVENIGTEPYSGALQFEFDEETSFFSSTINGFTLNGNLVNADITDLTPFIPRTYEITVKNPSGSSNLPYMSFNATLLDEAGEFIQDYGLTSQLRCSYDPNDKREYPDREGDKNLTLFDEDLEYTIRFQNNGNDTAYNVTIIDNLDPNIDPRSVRVVNASHDVFTCLVGSQLAFVFDDIYLVDSMTNYPGSQGYVTFKCESKEGVAEQTIVNNSAEIIFDTNPPIVSNTTINTLVSSLCTDKDSLIQVTICDGEQFLGYTEAGTYFHMTPIDLGCDSITTIELDVVETVYSTQDVQTCEGSTLLLGGQQIIATEDVTIIDTIVSSAGCISEIIAFEIDVTELLDEDLEIELCLNEATSFTAPLEGTWTSNDPTIVTVDNEGVITTVGAGFTQLLFTDTATGCEDDLPVTVHPDPILTNIGSNQICISDSTLITSDSEGTWTSSDALIAIIDNEGNAIGVGAGTVQLIFTNASTGCSSMIELEVLETSNTLCTTTVEEIPSSDIKLYPNPAIESIFIETNLNWTDVKIVNIHGQIIKSIISINSGKTEIDIKNLDSGMYMIMMNNKFNSVTKMFVVE